MASKGRQGPVELVLAKPVEVLKAQVNQRIEIGNNLDQMAISDQEDLQKLQSDIFEWEDINLEIIKGAFTSRSNEFTIQYQKLNSLVGVMDVITRQNESTLIYKANLEKKKISNTINWLKRFIQKIELINDTSPEKKNNKTMIKKCFLVHGHDGQNKLETARFIEKELKIETIILHEQPNRGRTIIEKFESFSEVDFAVALWTADDLGMVKASDIPNKRARQNVVFETGFFIGKLGRDKVIVLHEDGVELPSDYSGIIFISLNGNWKHDLSKEILEIYRAK